MDAFDILILVMGVLTGGILLALRLPFYKLLIYFVAIMFLVGMPIAIIFGIRYCQDCKYGFVKYPDWVETYEDTLGCTFESGCIYGLENTVPAPEEKQEFLESLKKK